MRFIDEAIIRVSGGHGGPGCVSFHREKYVPRGGPDGGDGGDGGSITFVATSQLGTLQDFRFRREYRAPDGRHGSGCNCAGRDGGHIEIPVPVGTVIRDAGSGETVVDFTRDGQRWLACKGGRGGKGNSHFVTSTFQAPKFAQDGEEGEARGLLLELKLLAHAAIVGYPNAGKSTLISRISAARPKIADYPFTTLTPNLGVVHVPELPDLPSFVVADIPGLIDGAHRGLGLGHKFLKHLERTSVFIHLLDGGKFLEEATNPMDPDSFGTALSKLVERYSAIRRELGLFSRDLLDKPEVVALNKVDALCSDPELLDRCTVALRKEITRVRERPLDKGEPYLVSAVSGQGIKELVADVFGRIRLTSAPSRPVLLPDAEDIRS